MIILPYRTSLTVCHQSHTPSALKAIQLTQCSHSYVLYRWVSLQFVHRVLAHELLCPQGGPSCEYYLVLAQTHLLKKDFAKTEEYLQQAVQMDYLVLIFLEKASWMGEGRGE